MEVEQINNNNTNINFTNERLSYRLDSKTRLEFEKGSLFKVSENNGKKKIDTLFSYPLSIICPVKQGDQWRLKYKFSGEERTDTILTMGDYIRQNMSPTGSIMSYFKQFLHKFKEDCEIKGLYEIWHDSVSVQDGKIMVENMPEQNTKHILLILKKLAELTTNREAFLTSLYYNLLAPLSFEIRSKGQKFPYRLSCGKTHGGKTAIESLFILQGFNQDLSKRKETKNTVKTIFTFGQQVENSNLPLLVDDTNNDWLAHLAEELKGATDGVKFMTRGTKAQTQNVWFMRGMPVFTMNADPDIPLALIDRLIISRYSEEHSKKQDKRKFDSLRKALKPGFMLRLISETLAGKTIDEVLNNVHFKAKNDGEVNERLIRYSEELMSELCKKYGLGQLSNGVVLESVEQSLLESFYTYVFTKASTLSNWDNSRSLKYCDVNKGKDKKDQFIYVSSEGFNDFLKDHRLRKMSMPDFINELKNPDIVAKTVYNPCLGKNVRCIVLPKSIGEPQIEPLETIVDKEYYEKHHEEFEGEERNSFPDDYDLNN